MIRKWYLRLQLWWWNVCPDHGPKTSFGYGWYCEWCNQNSREEYAKRLNLIRTEYNEKRFDRSNLS